MWKLYTDPESELSDEQNKMEEIKDIVYYGIIAVCAFTVVVAILGILTARYKQCCTIGLFSFLSLIVSVILIALGIIILLVSIASG